MRKPAFRVSDKTQTAHPQNRIGSTDSSVRRVSDSCLQGRGFDPHLGSGVVTSSPLLSTGKTQEAVPK